jgi:hypothetical protein
MNGKTILLFLFIFSVLVVPCSFGREGEHRGERNMLTVDIQFSDPYGKTVTNSEGVFYYIGDFVYHEDKVYPSEYWGEFPLYFFGTKTGVTVKVTNNGPRAKAKVRIQTEAYVLKLDGSNGVALLDPRIIDVEVQRGETKTIDASFVVEYREGVDSGLDRFVVKVLHINAGGGPGNSEPALIMVKEGIFCPPKYTGDSL